ncbi:MAG: hypothetical protein QXS81_04480 [Candidatus Micrarchaeaceae archaeon]
MHIKVKKGFAEKTKKYLLKKDALDRTKCVVHKEEYVYFPVKYKIKSIPFPAEYVKIKALERKKEYDELTKPLSARGINIGYDRLGNIAIIDYMEEKDAKKLADIIIASNKSITTVIKKAGPVAGRYRTRKYTFVSGKKTFIAKYKENDCTFVFDVRKTFFSSRLSFERARILKLVKSNENIIVMFAGVGPFAIEIAKRYSSTQIIAIELNPNAYRYMKKNIQINRITNIKPILGDVKKVYVRFKEFADRVVMPLPKISTDFLKEAFYTSKNRSKIHIYLFVEREGGIEKAKKLLKNKAKEYMCRIKIVFIRKVRDYSTSEIEIAVDMIVYKDR